MFVNKQNVSMFRKSPLNSPVGQNDDEFPCFKEDL